MELNGIHYDYETKAYDWDNYSALLDAIGWTKQDRLYPLSTDETFPRSEWRIGIVVTDLNGKRAWITLSFDKIMCMTLSKTGYK